MNEKITFAFGSALATAFLFWGAQNIVPLALFLNLFTPLPAAYAQMRCGNFVGGAAVIAAAIALGFLFPPAMVVGFLLQYGILAFAVPFLLRRGISWDRTVVLTVCSVMLIAGPLLVGYAYLQDVSPNQVVRQEAEQAVSQALALYDQGKFPAYEREQIEQTLNKMADLFVRVYPGLMAIIIAGVSLLLMVLLYSFSAGRYKIPGPGFSRWKSPEILIWGVIAGGFGLLLEQPQIRTVAINLLIVFVPIYFLQGLAVVTFFLKRKSVSPVIRSLIYFLIFILNPLPMVVTGVGVFDLWIDFRKPKIQKTS